MIFSPLVALEVVHNWPAETFIQRHVESLNSSGFPIQIFARHSMNLYEQNASLGGENNRISSHMLPNFNHFNIAEKLWSLRYLTSNGMRAVGISTGDKVVLGYFERWHPDLIHFHDASLAASMEWIPLTLGIPFTLSLRGSDIQVLPNRSDKQKEDTVSALENAKKIHAVCKNLGEVAKKITGNQQLDIQTIYTVVPIPDRLPQWFGAKNGRKLHFVSSGRLMWRKGFPQLLIALRHLLDQGEQARLTIVGTGPELDFILYMRKVLNLENHITLTGKMNFENFLQLLKSAHAYVQSSVAEGLSNALVEAMANGLPVFATDVDGTNEVVEDGVSGFLLPPLQPEKWADILIKVKDVRLMEYVRNVAYLQSRERFSPEKHAQDFIHFYQQALNG